MHTATERLSAQIVVDEVPLLMRAAAGVVLAFDAVGLAIGSGKHPYLLALDFLSMIVVLVVANAIANGRLAAERAPWAFALAASLVISVLLLAAWRQPGPSSLGFPLLFLATFPAIVTAYRPVLWTAPAMAALCSLTASHVHGAFDPDWTALFLGAAITGGVLLHLRMRMVARLAAAQEQAQHNARRDTLTGVLNRRGFEELVGPSVAAERRAVPSVFAAFIDVDGLKAVNDGAGHERGDAVLRRVARAIEQATRPGDLVVRYGGDEFVVIGPGDAPDPEGLRERIVNACALPAPIEGWVGTVSVGTHGAVGVDLQELIALADQAMYARRRDPR